MPEKERRSYDADIAVIANNVEHMQKDVTEVLTRNGLITTVALNKQSIKRVWWWVGSLSLTLVSCGLYLLVRTVS